MKLLEPFENKFSDLAQLRNRFIHDAGEITVEQAKTLKRITDSSEGYLTLFKEGSSYFLKIAKIEYMNRWYDTFRMFFIKLFWLIDQKQHYSLLLNRLQFMFNFLNPHIGIQLLEVKNLKQGGKELLCKIESIDFGHLYTIFGNITFANAKKDEVVLIDQVGNNEQITRLVSNLHGRVDVVKEKLFDGFVPGTFSTRIEIRLWP
jgi:hypothetical protein